MPQCAECRAGGSSRRFRHLTRSGPGNSPPSKSPAHAGPVGRIPSVPLPTRRYYRSSADSRGVLRVGELVRQGQEEGTIRSMGETAYRQPAGRTQQVGVAEAAGVKHRADLQPIREMANASAEDFDAAIEEAKAEGNLSRARPVRCHGPGPFNGRTGGRRTRCRQGPQPSRQGMTLPRRPTPRSSHTCSTMDQSDPSSGRSRHLTLRARPVPCP
jgi:hypothetical protein